jgi:hypothetical protein
MGQCGCGDYNGTWRIPGPDGRWYVIGPYHGCNNGCNEPAGLFIDLFDADDMALWDADKLPVIGGPEHENFGIPVLDVSRLIGPLAKVMEEMGFTPPDEYDSLRDALGDADLPDAVREAMWETEQAFKKQLGLTTAATRQE